MFEGGQSHSVRGDDRRCSIMRSVSPWRGRRHRVAQGVSRTSARVRHRTRLRPGPKTRQGGSDGMSMTVEVICQLTEIGDSPFPSGGRRKLAMVESIVNLPRRLN